MARYLFDIEVYILQQLPLPDNAVIFDVGCSYGDYTEELIRKMGDSPYTVHCFDAVEDFCNIQRNSFGKLPHIRINNIALGNRKGEIVFFRINAPGNEPAEGCSSLWLRPEFITNKWPYVPTLVKMETLDNYIAENNITHIDLMKMDVEGAEFLIFQGGINMFKEEMVNIIQFEYNLTLKDAGFFMADITNYISQFNYCLCDFLENKFIKLNPSTFPDDFGHHNYFLINNTYFNSL